MVATLSEQLEAGARANLAVRALEQHVRSQMAQAFSAWEDGLINNRAIRMRMERVVREAYRSAGAVARVHASQMAGIPGFVPADATKTTGYLTSLLEDVRRNMREFRSVDQTDPVARANARRRAVQNLSHSAGVAATRGYTDSLIESYGELADRFHLKVIKVWRANFVNNDPCEFCRALHGVQRKLRQMFRSRKGPRIYIDLQGPPRHPQCKCWLTIVIVTFDNFQAGLDVDNPPAAQTSITSEAIRKLPLETYTAIVASVGAVLKKTRGA